MDRPRRSDCTAGQMDEEAGWWTTSGNIGLPPLARVMGVGRQQQHAAITKDTTYTRWSCHSGMANPVQIVSTLPAPRNGCPITVSWASWPCGPAGWLVMLLIKAGDVETNPSPTTTRKQVWICNICHGQIQFRKQISIRCNRIEHWVPLRCAGIHLAQYTDTWTCHQHI